eukprot:gene8067-8930_t
MEFVEDISRPKRQKAKLRDKAKIVRLEEEIAKLTKQKETIKARYEACSDHDEVYTKVFHNSIILSRRLGLQTELKDLSVSRCVANMKHKCFKILTPIINKMIGIEGDDMLQYQTKEEILLKRVERLAEENKGLQMQVANAKEDTIPSEKRLLNVYKCKTCEGLKNDINDNCQRFEEEIERLRKDCNAFKEACFSGKEKHKIIEAEHEKLKKDNKTLKREHSKLQEIHESVKKNVKKLEKTSRLEDKKHGVLAEEHEKMKIKCTSVKDALATLNEKHQELEKIHRIVQNEIEILNETLKLDQEAHKYLEEEHKKVTIENISTKIALQILSEEQSKMKEDLLAAKKREEHLLEAVRNKEQKYNQLRKSFDDITMEKDFLKIELMKLDEGGQQARLEKFQSTNEDFQQL